MAQRWGRHTGGIERKVSDGNMVSKGEERLEREAGTFKALTGL